MSINFFRYVSIILFSTSLSLLIFGCGGGGSGGGGGSVAVAEVTYAVTGRVVDGSGIGVAGVTVSISSATGKLAKTVAASVVKTTTTDANGNYAFQVPNGNYSISSADSRYGFATVSVVVNGKSETTAQIAATPVLTVTGKVTQADGTTPVAGLTVKLYKTSFAIYSGAMYKGAYGTKNATTGVESVKIDSVSLRSTQTNDQGVYSFTAVSRGSYTIQPSDPSLYRWALDQSRSDTGVLTITESGMAYLYNPEEPQFANNKLSADGTIIYNIAGPFSLDSGASNKFDFKKSSVSGGILIQF